MSALRSSPGHSPKSFARCMFIVWGLFGSLSGCLGVPQVETPIHQNPQGQVVLKTFTDASVKASHPIIIDLELLQEIFRGLRVREQKEVLAALVSGEGQEQSIFTEQELQFLAPIIRDALAQATPEEFVWFELTNQKQLRPSKTSGALYISHNHLRLGLNEFQADHRHTKLSSTPSFSVTRLRNWSLGFFPAGANHQDRGVPDTFPLQAKIGAVTIALQALQNFAQSQKTMKEEITRPQPRFESQDTRVNGIQELQEEIGELQQQLEGQNRKLMELENRLEQNTGPFK